MVTLLRGYGRFEVVETFRILEGLSCHENDDNLESLSLDLGLKT